MYIFYCEHIFNILFNYNNNDLVIDYQLIWTIIYTRKYGQMKTQTWIIFTLYKKNLLYLLTFLLDEISLECIKHTEFDEKYSFYYIFTFEKS